MPIKNAPPRALTLERLATPIGTALLVTDEQGALRAFNWTDFERDMLTWIARHYPESALTESNASPSLVGSFKAYFEGDTRALISVPWKASGTAFQLRVWEALCTIPAGETLSYLGLARRIGHPTAVRAVGLANGANPVAIAVPCHRVIGTNGSLTGYGGGLDRKRWLLNLEGAEFNDRRAA